MYTEIIKHKYRPISNDNQSTNVDYRPWYTNIYYMLLGATLIGHCVVSTDYETRRAQVNSRDNGVLIGGSSTGKNSGIIVPLDIA